MRLKSIVVRNYRSFFVSKAQGHKKPDIVLGEGLNLVVGPNNCGKSNVLRAVALALHEPDDPLAVTFDYEKDFPRQLNWAYAFITLRFECGNSASERTLLKYLHEYEKSAGAVATYAEQGEVHLRVAHRPKSGREVTFTVKSKPNKVGDSQKLQKALTQLRKCIRFIYLRSGESLQEFLRGAFRELLHTVLREHLGEEFNEAESKRNAYLNDLSSHLFSPLGTHVLERLTNVLNEVKNVNIQPYVPSLPDTISSADIRVEDTADTALADKGSGVRGTLLVGLLSYLVEHSKRSLVLAVEEPESFLHPQAQEGIRRDLARLAQRSDISLLVTTHSPFLLDRSPSTRIIGIEKDEVGCSVITDSIQGDEPHTNVVSTLFGESITPSALETVHPLGTDKKAVLFLEGFTDKFYLEHAATVFGLNKVLDNIDVRFGNGAYKAAIDAILLRQMSNNDIPIMLIFDQDEIGKSARNLLTSKFNFSKKTEAYSYLNWCNKQPADVEAEDLFDQRFLKDFCKQYGENKVLSEKVKFSDGSFHYGIDQKAKDLFMEYVRENATDEHMRLWEGVLNSILERLGR